MSHTDISEQSAVHILTRCADELLNTEEPNITLRQDAGVHYFLEFNRESSKKRQIFSSVIPAYTSHLTSFLSLVENQEQRDDLRKHTLAIPVRGTIIVLNAAALWEKTCNTIFNKSSQGSDFLKTTAAKLDLADLLERLITIAEDKTQHSDLRKEAILTFNDLANGAPATVGKAVAREDYNKRFSDIAASARNRLLIEAAMHAGYR